VVDRGEPDAPCSEWHGDGTPGEVDRASHLVAVAPARLMGEARPRQRLPHWQAAIWRRGRSIRTGCDRRCTCARAAMTIGPFVAVGQHGGAVATPHDQQPLVGNPGPAVHRPSRADERLVVGGGDEQHRDPNARHRCPGVHRPKRPRPRQAHHPSHGRTNQSRRRQRRGGTHRGADQDDPVCTVSAELPSGRDHIGVDPHVRPRSGLGVAEALEVEGEHLVALLGSLLRAGAIRTGPRRGHGRAPDQFARDPGRPRPAPHQPGVRNRNGLAALTSCMHRLASWPRVVDVPRLGADAAGVGPGVWLVWSRWTHALASSTTLRSNPARLCFTIRATPRSGDRALGAHASRDRRKDLDPGNRRGGPER
jgi:hypothetical protein